MGDRPFFVESVLDNVSIQKSKVKEQIGCELSDLNIKSFEDTLEDVH